MKRWLPYAVPFVCVVGVAAFIAWPQLFPPRPGPGGDKSTSKDADKDQVEALVKDLLSEFEAGGDRALSQPARAKVGQLADLGPKGRAAAPLLDAWQKRLFDAGKGESADFKELARASLAVEPEALQRVVSAYLKEASYDKRLLPAFKLAAYGKPAAVSVAAAWKVEARSAGSLGREADSQLPAVLVLNGADAMPGVCEALRDPNPAVRRQAARTLALARAAKVPEAAAAVPDLEAALADKEPSVRAFAALALGDLAPHDKAPPAGLSAMLQDPDPLVRLAAAHALHLNTTVDPGTLAPVVARLLKTNALANTWWDFGDGVLGMVQDVRSAGVPYAQMYWEETAAHLLIALGPKGELPAAELVEMLRVCPHDGQHIVHLLVAQGPRTRAAIPGLVALLKEADPDLAGGRRRKALGALARLGPVLSPDDVAEVRAALDHPEGRTRWRAFLALCRLDPDGARAALPAAWQPAVPAVAGTPLPDFGKVDKWTQCYWHRKPVVLHPATWPEGTPANPASPYTLVDAETSAESAAVDGAITALEKAPPQGKARAAFLAAAFLGTSRDVWSRARFGPRVLQLIEREGPAAGAAAPALVRSLHLAYDDDALPKAMLALGDPSVEALAAALDDPALAGQKVQLLAMVQRFGPKAKPAVPAVLKALTDDDEKVQVAAAQTFGTLREGAAEAVPALLKLLGSDKAGARQQAIEALGRIGPAAKAALPDLMAFFTGENQTLRVLAVRAVSRIGKEALPPLQLALEDSREKVRLSAVEALTLMGAEAHPAVPALRKLANSEKDAGIREAAAELVKKLDK
jgi:HEAT repeat protein